MGMKLRLLSAMVLLSIAFSNCGKVNLADLQQTVQSSNINFKEIVVLVEVNHDKTVNILNNNDFKGTLTLEQNSAVFSKSFDKQGVVTLSETSLGEINFTPEFGYRGTLTVPVYIQHDQQKIDVIQVTFNVQNPMQNFRPALAVRAGDCMLCHANIRGDVISDFGYKSLMDANGEDLFFRRNRKDPNSPNAYNTSHSLADPLTSGWMTAKIDGNLYFPNVNFATLPILPNGETRIISKSPAYTENGVAKSASSFAEYLDKIYFTDKTRVKTLQQKEIYIGAPSEADIKTAGRLSAANPLTYIKNDIDKPNLSGLNRITAGGKDYYTNTGDVVCDGDLFIDGVVHLKNLRLKTENGCRMHVTKTVFITGPIEYVEEFALSNLQITSSRAIYLGMGMCYDCYPDFYNANFAINRAGNVEYWVNSFRDRHDLTGYSNLIQQDFLKVSNQPADIPRPAAGVDARAYYLQKFQELGVTLVDSSNPFDNTAATPFRRLLLNAPDVQSRYNGKFEGTIIAEFALWKLGQFTFQYDSVFTAVPIFPLIDTKKIIQVK
jgi:hypothetical protein